MAQFTKVAKSSEIGAGEMKEVSVQGNKVLLARVGDKYYAAEGRCTHMGGALVNGTLEGTVVTCPLHASQFDLKDGSIVKWASKMPKLPPVVSKIVKLIKHPRPLKTYPVKVDGEDISIEI